MDKEVAKAREVLIENAVMKARAAGMDHEAIAKSLQISEAEVVKALRRALKRYREETKETVQEVMDIDLQRTDALFLVAFREANAGDLGALSKAIRILERRAKMLGIDAAQKVQVEGNGGVVMVPADTKDWKALYAGSSVEAEPGTADGVPGLSDL